MSSKTGKIFIIILLYYYYFPDKCLLNYHNDSSTIPIAFILFHSTILIYKYRDDSFRYYERRQSQRQQRFDLELDIIFISVLINLGSKLLMQDSQSIAHKLKNRIVITVVGDLPKYQTNDLE